MKNKKKKINEGMILVSPLLPVHRIDSLTGRKKDNFEFKGLPEQFNENGEKILDEQGNRIDEAVKYPTQDEAERINEFINFLDQFSWGLNGKAKELFNKIEKFRAPYFEYAFGDKSPWSRDIRAKKGREVFWDKNKAEKLGI